MPANVDGMVREGINAYRAGRKDEARALLMRAVELDQYNEMGWIWLSAVVDTPEEQRTCLENVLVINPTNETARKGLDVLANKSAPSTPPPPPKQADDILAGASFTAVPPPPPTPPPSSPAEEEELPDIDWHDPGIVTSSASSRHSVNELSPADYDDWVKDLNLGTGSSATSVENAEDLIASTLFGDDDGSDLPDLGQPTLKDAPPLRRSYTPHDVADNSDLDDDSPFSSSSVDEINTMLDEMRLTPEAPPPPIPENVPSPMRNRRKSRKDADSSPTINVQRGLPDIDSAHQLLDQIEEEREEDYDQAEFDKRDPVEYFAYIPKEIKPTRIPGTNERYPALVLLGALVLLAANIGAVYLLINGLGA